MNKKTVPIVDGLFTWPSDNPRLISSRCPVCGSIQFPKSVVCNNPECDHSETPEEYLLSQEGILYSYTVHYYSLGGPLSFHKAPYAVGAIKLPEDIIIIGRLTETDEKKLRVGMKVRLKIDKLYEDEDNIYLTYFFEPIGGVEEVD